MNETMHEQSLWRSPRIERMVLLTLLIFALFLIVEVVSGIRELRYIGGGVPATNTISVGGEGEVFAVPDIATFTYSVVEEGKTVKEAQDKATEKTNAILAFLHGED